MSNLIVNSQNKAYVINGKALDLFDLYDSEIEYLEIDGAQAINTLIYPTVLDLDIRYESANGFRFGWTRQNVATGTWININQVKVFWKNWNSYYALPSNNQDTYSVWRYDMKTGLYKDGTLIRGFTTSLGANSISSVPLYIGDSFDLSSNSLDVAGNSDFNIKLKWLQVYRNNVLILDLIPVRKGNVGYMYDKISKKLFENVGSGSFVLGSDIN